MFLRQFASQLSGDGNALRMLLDHGRMIARKDSPIWAELGSSANFDDSLDVDYPPFAFNSGIWVRDIDRDEALALGLIEADTVIEPKPPPDFNAAVQASIADLDDDIKAILKSGLGNYAEFDGDTVRLVSQAGLQQLQEQARQQGFSQAIIREIAAIPPTLDKEMFTVTIRAGQKAFYDIDTKTIFANQDATKWHGKPQTLIHELGHHFTIDRRVVNPANSVPSFAKALQKDRTLLFERANRGENLGIGLLKEFGMEIPKSFSAILTDPRFNSWSALADAIAGATQERFGKSGHPPGYFSKDSIREMEIAAHAARAILMKDEVFVRYFPNVVAFLRKEFGL